MSDAPEPRNEPRVRPELTRWKQVLLGCATAFVAIGLGLQAMGGPADSVGSDTTLVADVEPESNGDVPSSNQVPKSSLVTDDSPQIEWPPKDPQDDSPVIEWPPKEGAPVPAGDAGSDQGPAAGAAGWSPFFLKGGFSFLVAFCVGYATRVWLKMAAFFIGTFFLGVFLLSYLGALDVDWLTLEGWWDTFAGRIEAEASDFKTFLTGSLPQAGMAGLGLVAGFRRR